MPGRVSVAVGAAFRSARESQRLSQDQVAALTHSPRVPRTTISSIERGENLPGIEVLVALTRALHLDPSAILEIVALSADERDLAASLDPTGDHEEARLLRARCELDRASILKRRLALHAARSAAERAVCLAAAVPELQARAYEVLAGVLVLAGMLPFARDAAEHAVRLARRGAPDALATALIEQAHVCASSGDHEAARIALVEARALLAEIEDGRRLSEVEGNLARCLLAQGRASLARERLLVALDLARRHGARELEATWLVELGQLHLGRHELDRAEACARAALRIARPLEHVPTIFRGEWLQHLVVTKRDPGAPIPRRLATLRRLHGRPGHGEL